MFRNCGPRHTSCNTLKLIRNSVSLNLLETKGPVQACKGLLSNFLTLTWNPDRLGEEKNILSLPGFELHILQPIGYSLCWLSYPDSLELTENLQKCEVIFLSLQLLNAPTCHQLVPVGAEVISTSQQRACLLSSTFTNHNSKLCYK